MNKLIISGNVGKDPEIKTFDNGNRIANLTLAVSEKYKTKDGEKREETEWFDLTVSGNMVSVVEKYIAKGSKLLVDGKMKCRKWTDNEGKNRYSWYVRVERMEMLSSKAPGSQSSPSASPNPSDAVMAGTPPPPPADDADDLPF